MWSRLEEVGGFLYRHRRKVAAGAVAVVAIGACAALYFSLGSKDETLSAPQTIEDAARREESASARRSTLSQQLRRVARIHEQFEQTLQLFVPTLHIKVVSVVDVNSTIAKIKELRASRPESSVDEDELWEEIKVNTFALVLVCAYSLCTLSVLLKIQLHIIAGSNFASQLTTSDGSNGRKVIEGTYAHFYDKGVEALYHRLPPIVRDKLVSWKVRRGLARTTQS